jgi:aspartate/methionine/tyrosine aminotransferase
MTRLANERGAVNLGQGFPDFAPPGFLLEAAGAAFSEPGLHQYAPPQGWPRLREAVGRFLAPQLGFEPDPMTEVTVTVGATEGLHAAMQALLEPGDEAIVIEPHYDCYAPQVRLAGGLVSVVSLEPGPPDAGAAGWRLDPAILRAACTQRTRLIVLNTPHNPTGKVFSRPELEEIAAVAQEFDLIVLSDEVYDRLTLGVPHLSIAALPGMRERSVTCGSAGKLFSATGWRIGWAIAPAAVTRAMNALRQWVPFAAATPVQEAVARALESADLPGYLSDLNASFVGKRNRLTEALESAGLATWQPDAGYFVITDARHLAADAVAASHRFLDEVWVASIPVSVFYEPERRSSVLPALRFAYCKSDRVLDEAVRRLGVTRLA